MVGVRPSVVPRRLAWVWPVIAGVGLGVGRSSSVAGWPGWRPSRRCSATPTPPTGRSRSSAPSRSRLFCNRVLLSSLLAGAVGEPRLALRHPQWLKQRGVSLRLGVPVRHVDTQARTVELADGETLDYDDLVLATGSRPFVPPIPGAELAGVHVFRTPADVHAIRAGAASARRAVVIGGGLLGLEAARGLREHGVHVTVVHLADRLHGAAARRARLLDAGPVAARAADLPPGPRRAPRRCWPTTAAAWRAVALEGGEELRTDMVVITAGVRPEVDLARTSGLEVERGILVDDELRTSAPGVRAVGECAEHRGALYGLWAPLLEQAKTCGASLATRPTRVPRRLARDDVEGRRHRALLLRSRRRGGGRRGGADARHHAGVAIAGCCCAMVAWRARSCSAICATPSSCGRAAGRTATRSACTAGRAAG